MIKSAKSINSVGAILLAAIVTVTMLTSCCCQNVCQSYKNPQKTKIGTLSILHLRGTWREMGVQYGELMKEELKAAREFAGVHATEPSDPVLLPNGLPCGVEFIDDLMSGTAEGAGLTLDDMAIINGVEIAYLCECDSDVQPYLGKCSALNLFGDKAKDGQRIYGRNYDWLSSFEKIGLAVTYFHPSDSNLEVATINYPGCFYLTTGMNSAGLFVELNDGSYASTASNDKCIHNAWLLWNVLLQSRDTQHAVNMLQSLSPKGNYLIGLTDSADSAIFEWGVASNYVHQADDSVGMFAFSNHFLRPDWKNTEDAEWGGLVSSVNRRQGLLKLGEQIPNGTGDLDTMKRILSVPVENGGAKWTGTIFQVIAIPELKEMHVHCCNSDEWIPVHFSTN